MRQPYDRLLKAAEPDPNWNIILYLMKHHLRGENVTKSSLASSADIPFATAMTALRHWRASSSQEPAPPSPWQAPVYVE